MWLWQDKEFTENDVDKYIGFVYEITEIDTGKKYVGQKVFWNKTVKKPLKGKVNKRRGKKPSDWQEYYGSNEELKNLVAERGKDFYTRKILRLCTYKSELNYYEAREIFIRDAVIDPMYFNSWCSVRVNQAQLKAVIDEWNKI